MLDILLARFVTRLKRRSRHRRHARLEIANREREAGTTRLLTSVRRIHGWAKRTQGTVAQLFAEIDVDSSGSIDIAKFRMGLAVLGLKFTNEETNALLKHMDSDGDGVLDTAEFCQKMTELLELEASSAPAILSAFLVHLRAKNMTAAEFFAQHDLDGSGTMDGSEFHALLQVVGINVSESSAWAALAELDLDGGGSLEINEIRAHLEEYARERRVFAASVLGRVCHYLDETNMSVVRMFARVDADGSGTLDVLELQEVLRRMNLELSELEVEEVMCELTHQREGMGTEMTSWEFLDKLKQFRNEHQAHSEKCRAFFEEADDDSSGYLDPSEVLELAKNMGLGERLADPASKLTLEKILEDIQSARESAEASVKTGSLLLPVHRMGEKQGDDSPVAAAQVAEGGGNSDQVTYDELLPWFLNIGRSYLPQPVYIAVEELEQPSEEALRTMFTRIDSDGSGEVCKSEAVHGALSLFPYADTYLVETAFEAADADGSGWLHFDEFDELILCLVFLNQNRHEIAEMKTQFATSGVGDFEFYVCLAELGIHASDAEASHMFDVECVRLDVTDSVLTLQQVLLFLCRRECISKSTVVTSEWDFIAEAAVELEEAMTDFGDIFFDDLARVVYTQSRRQKTVDHEVSTKATQSTKRRSAFRSAAKEGANRFAMLKAGIQKALRKHEVFPVLNDDVIAQLVRAGTTDLFYARQNLFTANMYEDTFYIIRRGRVELVIDGEVHETLTAGDPVGEMALMYGTKHSTTVRTVGPCEVFMLDRGSYETVIASLPKDQQQGPLLNTMQKFWVLVTGLDGSKRPEVDYAAYLKYHNRVSKTLMKHHEATEYDPDDQREIALDDWGEDCKRFDVKTTGVLTQAMFYDSLYQMVELWAGDLALSFVGFLELLFDNIAAWRDDPPPAHWAFKPLDDVSGAGEQLEDIQEKAKQVMEAEAVKLRQKSEEAEGLRLETERKAQERRERMRELHALRLAEQKKEMILREEAELNGKIEDLLQRVDDGDESAKAELRKAQQERLELMTERLTHEETLGTLADAEAELQDATLEAEALFEIMDEDASNQDASRVDLNGLLVDAVLANNEVDVRRLLSDGAHACTSSKGWPVLAIASQRGFLNILRVLVNAGADVGQTLPSGATSLIVASDAGESECVATLLSFDANANAARTDGATSLHMAAAKGHPRVVSLLLGDDYNRGGSKSRADPEKLDGNGATALAVASHSGHDECTFLLRRALAKKWRQVKLAEWDPGSQFCLDDKADTTLKLAQFGGAEQEGLPTISDATRAVAGSSCSKRVLRGFQTTATATGHQPGYALRTPLLPRTPRRGKRNNLPTRNIWSHDVFDSKNTGALSSGRKSKHGNYCSIEKQLNSALGLDLAMALREIVQEICGETQQSSRRQRAKTERQHATFSLSAGHLRLLHQNLRGGSIVVEAVRRANQTVAVRVIVLSPSHAAVPDPCIICLSFRSPLDVMVFGSRRHRWDPVALEEMVDMTCATCHEYTMVQLFGKQASAVRPWVSLYSRLVAYGGEVQFFGARTKIVPWQYERRHAETIMWLRGPDFGEVIKPPGSMPGASGVTVAALITNSRTAAAAKHLPVHVHNPQQLPVLPVLVRPNPPKRRQQ